MRRVRCLVLVPFALVAAACQNITQPRDETRMASANANAALAGPLAYVTDSQLNAVSVIETATNAVVATIDVGSNPLAPQSPRMALCLRGERV
ncbi:MAG: hypothetical protein ACYSVY_17355 [Planctomycetota bacterium]|jgi:YVTN family beta-propeller protein